MYEAEGKEKRKIKGGLGPGECSIEGQSGRKQSYSWIRNSLRIEFVLDLAPKLVCAALYRYKYYAETRTVWKKKESERKKEKRETWTLRLTYFHCRVSLGRLDNFMLSQGIYCITLADFSHYFMTKLSLDSSMISVTAHRTTYHLQNMNLLPQTAIPWSIRRPKFLH